MAYDEELAARVRKTLARRRGVTEKKMFGGLAFLVQGNMCCGVLKKDLVLRLGKEGTAKALKERHTRKMDFTGRALSSMVYVAPSGYRTDEDLSAWVKRALVFVKTLPPKE